MKLTFLGTSHGKPERDRFCTSTVLTVAGKHYIIDAGAPIVDLMQRSDLAFEDIAGIFITHSHIDHIAGLPLLTATLNSPRRFFDVAFPVYVPDLSRYEAMFEFIRGTREPVGRLTYLPYQAGCFFDNGTVRITAIPTKHFENSHAFQIEAEGKSVVFTGDLRADLSDYPPIIYEAPHDLVVMEAAHQHYDDPLVVRVLQESKTRRMAIHHIAELRSPLPVIQEALSRLPFPAQAMADGDVIEL